MSNRILDYPEATAITSDDYILLDNEGTGAKCIKASALNVNMDNYTIKEARGAIASFDDGEDLPLAFMGAYITAIQDLHGYDSPWVGGSGKNKCDTHGYAGISYNGAVGTVVTFTDSTITVNVNKNLISYSVPSWGGVVFKTSSLPSGTYHFHAELSSTVNRKTFYVLNSNNVVKEVNNYSDSGGTLGISRTLESGDCIAIWIGSNNAVDITITNMQIESGNSYTTFAPYSNECPIIGWNGVNVGINDGNWWDEEYQIYGSGASARIGNKNPIPCKPNTTYYITKPPSNGWKFYDKDMNVLANYYNQTYTTPSNCYFMSFQLHENYGTTYNHDVCINTVSYDYYTPYNGNTYSLTFTDGSNPLTVYGGYVDLVSGVLTINKVYVDMGSLTYSYETVNTRFLTMVTGIKKYSNDVPFNAQSEIYKAVSANDFDTNRPNSAMRGNQGNDAVFFRDTRYTDEVTFKNAVNGKKLVYELATPLTYQLSPTIIYSLIGENNIFADTGDSIVDYRKIWVKPEM